MSELDPFGAEQPIKRPVSNDREFQNGEPLFNEISKAIKNGTKNFVVYGPEKSGKTSFTNVLPDNLPVGFIGVRVELEFLGEEPIYSVYDQIFSSVFRKLIEKGYLEEKNEYYKAWTNQVDRMDLDVNPDLELLAIGSRIALYLKTPTSPITINKGLIENDWLRLKKFTSEIYPDFIDFMIILDDPQQLLNLDPKTQTSFFRVFETEKSPLLLVTVNLFKKLSKKENADLSLLDLLIGRLPDLRLDLSLQKLGRNDISEIIKEVRRDLDPKSMVKVSRSVRDVTGGHPYLIKLLLNNIDKRSKQTGKFEVDRTSCEGFIDSRLVKLLPEPVTMYQTLKKLRATDTPDFLKLSIVLLATSQSRARPGSGRRVLASHKSLTEIVLNNYAPKAVNQSLLDSELESYLKCIQKYWRAGLFNVLDNDGKEINSIESGESSFININSRIVTDIDPLILAYLRISARELDENFVTPSTRTYFITTTDRFAESLVDFLLPEDNKLLSTRKIPAYSPSNNLKIAEEGLTTRISKAVRQSDLRSLYTHFFIPLRDIINYNFINSGNVSEPATGTPVIFNLVLSELNLPEFREFSFILYLEPKVRESDLEARFTSWLDTHAPIMELFYKIKVVQHSLEPFPDSLFKNLLFICGRALRFKTTFEHFRENRFVELRNFLKDHLKHELILIDQYPDFSESREKFQRIAQSLSFMAASTGLFEPALKGFGFAIKDTYSNAIMIEDNKSIVLANLGDLENAADVSLRNLQMLREKRLEHDDYYKLIYIPFRSNHEVPGSSAIEIQKWSLFTYELQHAILLLEKKKTAPLRESEHDFLKVFAESMTHETLSSLLATKQPIHRMLAYYLVSVDSHPMAVELLERFISTNSDSPQAQAAISDLTEIKTRGK